MVATSEKPAFLARSAQSVSFVGLIPFFKAIRIPVVRRIFGGGGGAFLGFIEPLLQRSCLGAMFFGGYTWILWGVIIMHIGDFGLT
ncbi:hypothetical protein [Trueperella pyogenes]|uniref:hypothetical protein n=1 Tax=Trueperella pyogenes TaxID=1661 RepID=UPI00131F1D7F|nr:hypothetical protein [Trueperella pyogenes]